MKKILAFLITALSLVALSCGDTSGDGDTGDAGAGKTQTQIKMIGSTTVLPIAQACAEAYMAQNPGTDISVAGGGSSVGITKIVDGEADIGNASRAMKDSEKADAEAKGVTPVEHVVALDAIVVVVNKSVTGISDIAIDDLKKIYLGEIKNWKEVGGPDQDIVVISRDHSSGTYETFEKLVMKKEKVVESAIVLAGNNPVAKKVADTPGAVGYVGFGFREGDFTALTVNGIPASEDSARTMKYPIARELYMYTKGEPQGDIKAFMDFIKGDAGKKIVVEQGFISK